MASKTPRDAFLHFLRLEQAFWTKVVTLEERRHIIASGLDPLSQLCCGEVLFMLLGLKPTVLFSHIQLPELPNMSARFHESVLTKFLEWFSSNVLSAPSFAIHALPSNIHAQNLDLSNMYVFSISDHPVSAEILPLLMEKRENEHFTVSEKVVAQLLDYPSALPDPHEDDSHNEEDEMLEIGYCLNQPSSPIHDILLTSYGARQSELPLVNAHFQRYKEASSAIGVDLSLKVLSLSEQG